MAGCKRDIAVLIVLQVVLGLAYLSSIPRLFTDEAWDSSVGYNLAHKGTLSHPFIEGFGGMHINFVQNRVVLPFVCAAIFKVAGYGVLTSRIGSLIFSLLAVVGLYAVTRRWFGEKQAFWIVLATIINPWFFEVSRRARPEIYYTALALVFLWLMVVFFDSGSRRTAFFAGVFAGLSTLTHPNGVIIVFSISLAMVIWNRNKSIGRLILWASVGFSIVILLYIVYVLWAIQDPQVSFIKQMQASMLQRPFLRSEIIRWRVFLRWPKGAPLAAVMLTAWLAAWYCSSSAEKILATIILLFAFLLSFASVNPTGRYLTAIVPFFSALIVRLIWRIINGNVILQNWRKTRFAIGLCTGFVYLLMCIVGIMLLFYYFLGADFNKVIQRVASVVEPDSRVYGDPVLWFGQDHYQYGPWLYISENEPITVREAINWASKYRFDYAVRVTSPPTGIRLPPKSMPDFRVDNLCDQICRIFGTKIDEFYDPYYGPVEIYKLNWEIRRERGKL
jgi:4-amino-4-deoxy-L-arabinose transferase-like glycosyltransferase